MLNRAAWLFHIYYGRHFGLPDRKFGEPVSERVKKIRSRFAGLKLKWIYKFQDMNRDA